MESNAHAHAHTQTQSTPNATPAAASYPAELVDTYRAGTGAITAEDYPVLLEKHGKYMVMVGRMTDGLSFFVTRLAMIKVGIIGRCAKLVAAPVALKYLSAEDGAMFTGRDEILVCCPPVSGEQAVMLADLVTSEECFLHTKLQALTALDVSYAITDERVRLLGDEISNFFHTMRRSYESRVHEVETPVGEWNIYTQGGGAVDPDKLAAIIRGFASRSARVFPPIPPIDPEEITSLFKIHDILTVHGFCDVARRMMTDALQSPYGAHICHRPEVSSGEIELPKSEIDKRDVNGVRETMYGHLDTLLGNLLSEELTHAALRDKRPLKATPANRFILTLEEILALKIPHAPRSTEHAFERLNMFVGGYLKNLDLSKTMITGSAIAASLIITDVERLDFCAPIRRYMNLFPHTPQPQLDPLTNAHGDTVADSKPTDPTPQEQVAGPCIPTFLEWTASMGMSNDGYRAYIDSHYPPTRTIPEDLNSYRQLVREFKNGGAMIETMTTKTEEDKTVLEIAFKPVPLSALWDANSDDDEESHGTIRLTVTSGADVDMAVDVETVEEFDRIAHDHFRVIRAMYPEAKLHKVDTGSERHNWVVTTDCPGSISTFRPVEIYRANFNHVTTHHVGMVSGAYTAIFGGAPRFIATARLAVSMKDLATPNYYYFASRKTLPQHVILKYMVRGFGLESFPKGLRNAIEIAKYKDPIWYNISDEYPTLNGIGMFSAYALKSEKEAFS